MRNSMTFTCRGYHVWFKTTAVFILPRYLHRLGQAGRVCEGRIADQPEEPELAPLLYVGL